MGGYVHCSETLPEASAQGAKEGLQQQIVIMARSVCKAGNPRNAKEPCSPLAVQDLASGAAGFGNQSKSSL